MFPLNVQISRFKTTASSWCSLLVVFYCTLVNTNFWAYQRESPGKNQQIGGNITNRTDAKNKLNNISVNAQNIAMRKL